MKIYDKLEQKTEEWLTLRLGKFTASQAQAIGANGKGLETLCFDKAAEILTGKIPESYTNSDMERGEELETMARSAYELDSGNEVIEVGFIDSEKGYGCSPDGLVGDDGMVEFKCPNDRVFTEYLYTEKIDPKYFAQMQMQMLVSERKWVDYVVYNENFPNPIMVKRVERDEKVIEKIQKGLDDGLKKLDEILKKLL